MTTEFKVGDRVVALENVYKENSPGLGTDKPVPEGTLGTVVRVFPTTIVSCPYDVEWDNGNDTSYPMYPDEIKAADE